MQTTHSSADLLRRIGFLALLGFGIVFLSGPILAVLSVVGSLALTVLTFAAIGFVVWLPIRIVTAGKETAWRNIRDAGGHVASIARGLPGWVYRVASAPARAFFWLCAGAGRVVAFVVRKAWATARFATEIGLVTAIGAALGAGLGLVLSPSTDLETAVAMNALAGGVLAAGAGVAMHLASKGAARSSPVHVRVS